MSIHPGTDRVQAAHEEDLVWEAVPEPGGVRLRAIGTLDLATAPRLDEQLVALLEAGHRKLTLDLAGLTFMDSSGLRLVLRWDAAARRDGFAIAFVPGPPRVQRVFELTNTLELVAFVQA